MNVFYDFNNCRESLKQFGGSDKKEAIFFNERRYMLKYNDFIPENQRNDYTSSSRNNAFSEYISCHIFEAVGIPVQKTLLGEKNGHIVVACEDFCVDGYELNEFEKNSSMADVDFQKVRYPEINDVISFIEADKRIDSDIAKERFWDTFVMDAFLGNFDRHTGNWGYLYNDDKHETILAPVYDCGACLYPMISDEAMKNIVISEEEINLRIYKYPTAAFMYDGKKVLYYDFMTSDEMLNKYPELGYSIEKIVEMIEEIDVKNIIDETPNMSSVRKEFYFVMLKARYEKILIPAYEKVQQINLEYNKSNPFFKM
ncbi:MAG: HipA domain-containing protein [Lachnospiraceae bacterium]|nr:HipA domain-containing protein [Lachnospiraceae bacterium]